MRKRLTALVTVAAMAGVAGGSVSSHAAAHASAVTTPRCKSSALQVWLGVGNGGADAGTRYLPLEYTNVSRHSCHLVGYPGVSAHSTHRLGSAASRVAATVNRVTLSPGATAHSILELLNVANFPPATCRPATATTLRVYPPNDFRSTTLSFRFRACSLRGPAFLFVYPVRPHVGVPGYTTP